jgi:hypothetical protein
VEPMVVAASAIEAVEPPPSQEQHLQQDISTTSKSSAAAPAAIRPPPQVGASTSDATQKSQQQQQPSIKSSNQNSSSAPPPPRPHLAPPPPTSTSATSSSASSSYGTQQQIPSSAPSSSSGNSKDERKKLLRTINHLRADLEAADEQTTGLAAELLALSKKNTALTNALKSSAHNANADLESTEDELSDALAREKESIIRAVAVDEANAKLRAEHDTLSHENNELIARAKAWEARADKSNAAVSAAEEKVEAQSELNAKRVKEMKRREGDLESQIAELSKLVSESSAAVAAEKQKQQLLAKNSSQVAQQASFEKVNTVDNSASGEQQQAARVEQLQIDLSTAMSRLEHEKAHSLSLSAELRNSNAERVADDTRKAENNDRLRRRITELSNDVAKLEGEKKAAEAERRMRGGEHYGDNDNADGNSNGSNSSSSDKTKLAEHEKRITLLSDQILKTQLRADELGSEKAALAARLRASLARAKEAERAMAEYQQSELNGDGDDRHGNSSGNLNGGSGGGGLISRRRGNGRVVSISKAMNLNAGGGGSINSSTLSLGTPSKIDRRQLGKEKVADVVDAVDVWSIEFGTILKHNPIARLFFLLYMGILHLWLLAMLFFHHSHSFEVEHGDFGSMKYRHLEQMHGHPLPEQYLPAAAAAAVAAGNPNDNVQLPGQ